MKMNSYRRSNNRRTAFGTAFLAVLFSVVMLFTVDTMTNGAIRSIAHSGASVVWMAAASVSSIADFRVFITGKHALILENESLKLKLQETEEKFARINSIEEENFILQDMINLAQKDTGISARIISTFRTSPYGTFIIDIGSDDGVTVGSIAVTPSGYVLGKVTNVDRNTASIQSLFSPGAKTDFLIGALAFSAYGRGGGNTRADVPRDAIVTTGDVVLAPAFGGRAAGIVGAMESASSSATKTLYIRIPTNLATLRFVYVIPQ